MPDIITGQVRHVHALAPRIRLSDAAESEAFDTSPSDALRANAEFSDAGLFTVADQEDGILAMFGGCFIGSGKVAVWMKGSELLVTKHRRWLIANTPRMTALGFADAEVLHGAVDARNAVHVRWLRFAGYSIEPALPLGPHGLPFHPIHLTRDAFLTRSK